MTRGVLSLSRTLRFSGKRISRSVSLKSCSISSSAGTLPVRGSSTMRTSSANSSRTSSRIGSFLALMISAMRSISRPFCTWYGNLGDDDPVLAARQLLLLPARAQAEGAAAGLVGLDDRLARLDQDAAGREVRPLHQVDQRLDAGVRRLDQMQQRVAQLAGIVRRDRARHADGDAGRAVGQQVGEAARQHDRLLGRAVVVGPEVDGILVDAGQQRLGHLGEARLGVTHRGRVIAVDIAEVALPLDQRIAGGEFLGEAHQRVVDRLVAVRVILADHVADDAGALLEGAVGVEPQLAHGVHQPAMHRLQPVAHVGQRARHDGRQRIGQIALLERLSELHRLDGGEWNDVVAFCHRPGRERGPTAIRATAVVILALERFHKSRPRGRQGLVVRPENVPFEEIARQIEALAQLARRRTAIRRWTESAGSASSFSL